MYAFVSHELTSDRRRTRGQHSGEDRNPAHVEQAAGHNSTMQSAIENELDEQCPVHAFGRRTPNRSCSSVRLISDFARAKHRAPDPEDRDRRERHRQPVRRIDAEQALDHERADRRRAIRRMLNGITNPLIRKNTTTPIGRRRCARRRGRASRRFLVSSLARERIDAHAARRRATPRYRAARRCSACAPGRGRWTASWHPLARPLRRYCQLTGLLRASDKAAPHRMRRRDSSRGVALHRQSRSQGACASLSFSSVRIADRRWTPAAR